MKQEAAPAQRRGRALPDQGSPPEFVHSAHILAIQLAARDAHRAVCNRDVVECDTCREYESAIRDAELALSGRWATAMNEARVEVR